MPCPRDCGPPWTSFCETYAANPAHKRIYPMMKFSQPANVGAIGKAT
jgi:hypothetical protein